MELNDEFISKFINFLRSKEGLTFPMILHAFEEKKKFPDQFN